MLEKLLDEIKENPYSIVTNSFTLDKQHLRSELDITFRQIRINRLHPDYVDAEKKSRETFQRYLALLISKEIAYGEYFRRCKERTVEPEDVHLLTETVVELYQNYTNLLRIS